MSVQYQVLIKTRRGHKEIAAWLSEITGVRFERVAREDELEYSARVFGHDMSLFDTSGFEDDDEIAVTQYPFYVDIDRSGILRYHPNSEEWHEQIAKMIAHALIGADASPYAAAQECIVLREWERTRFRARYPVMESARLEIVA